MVHPCYNSGGEGHVSRECPGKLECYSRGGEESQGKPDHQIRSKEIEAAGEENNSSKVGRESLKKGPK